MEADGSHKYPDQLDWADLCVIHRNTLQPRANFHLYESFDDCLSRDDTKRRALSLSGQWSFKLTQSPLEHIDGFSSGKTDDSWNSIDVPGMWQLQGYGHGPHYTNVQYPFFVGPPLPPYTKNETGHYVKSFTVPGAWTNDQLRLRFEGVDSAFHVYLNGKQVGYSQGARNPSEFDITDFVKQGAENVLSVRVYQFCNGSYIEDQDQWWLSGIFRDVFLLAFPKVHFRDFTVNTHLDHKYKDARLDVYCELSAAGLVSLKLLDADRKEVAKGSMTTKETEIDGQHVAKSRHHSVHFSFHIKDPHKWTAETPYLYHLVLSDDDKLFTGHRVGFRSVEVKDGLLKVNGERIVFKGTNRHEHHPKFGRAVPYDFMKKDLLLMKTHNINAIRTCHQPSDPRMYDLADELGFWVMDEADLECHGFAYFPDAHTYTSDNPAWKDSYVDRAQQLVHRDKLHPSVVLWSLGNEAFYGRNHTAMVKWIKSYDPSRPIHYEQDYNADHVDIYSKMYPSTDEIIDFAHTRSQDKPLVLCEFVHAMGTGPGGIKEYVEAFYKYPALQGGWVWEWANHGLLRKNAEGEDFYGYGGDFDDEPNDGTFVMDGMLNSDHTPNSGLIEYKKAIEPVQVTSSKPYHVKITNRRDFTTLDDLNCVWRLVVEDGKRAAKGIVELPSDIKPGDTAELRLPHIQHDGSAEALVELSFRQKHTTAWASKGHEVAWGQVALTTVSPIQLPPPTDDGLHVEHAGSTIVVSSGGSRWTVDLAYGSLSSWRKHDVELIAQPLLPSFYRAPTDNDSPQDGWDWRDRRLQYAAVQTHGAKWRTKNGEAIVELQQKFVPPVIGWFIDLETTYTFHSDGYFEFRCKGTPGGRDLPRTLPRIGVTLGLPESFQKVQWFGRGGESYKDMKLSQRLDLHSASSIDDLWTGPDHPQDCSNRTDTRWLKLASHNRDVTVQFVQPKHSSRRHLFDFMACHYDVADIDRAKHPFELEKQRKDYVVLRLDADHHGLGSASCGPKTREEYALKTEPFEFGIIFF